MRIRSTLVAVAAISLFAITGCAVASDSQQAVDVQPRDVDAVLPILEESTINFDVDSARLVWEGEDASFYTATDTDNPDFTCLLPVSSEGRDLVGGCSTDTYFAVSIGEEFYAYGTKPDFDDEDWKEVATDFWLRDA
ncbi:hypothetical protein [Leucobacter chromiireducens]|uniref:hypothetical protein n=1 Tax=Leucobacter chromiireducens TaxID=283877 RepID=UPI003F7E0688